MTIEQITKEVGKARPLSRRQVCRYIQRCGIRPVGVRQRPQQYPAAAVETIIQYLGLDNKQILSLKYLQSVRRHSRQNRRAA